MTPDEQQWFDLLHSELNKTQTDERRIRYANDFVRAELALNKIRKTDTVFIEPHAQRYFDSGSRLFFFCPEGSLDLESPEAFDEFFKTLA